MSGKLSASATCVIQDIPGKGKISKMGKQKESARQALWERIDSLISKNWSSHLQMVGLTFLLLTIQIWQLNGYDRLSLTCFLVGIICLSEASSAAIRFKKNLQPTFPTFQRNTVFLLLLEGLSLFFLLFNRSDIIEVIGIFGEVMLTLGLAVTIITQGIQLYFTTPKFDISKNKIIEITVLGALCIFFGFILNIEVFNTWVRWDSYNYFRNFEQNWISAKDLFRIGGLKVCSHISTPYTLYTLLFRMLPISDPNAMYLSQMFLMAIDFVLLYYIFKKLLPDGHLILQILCALAVVCSPWVFGRIADLNSELMVLTGVLLLLHAVFSNNPIIGVFSTFILCNARETGAPVAAAIIFTQLLYFFIKERKKQNRLTVEIKWIYFASCLALGVMWLLQFRSGNWTTGRNGVDTGYYLNDGQPLNQFGFSWLHIQRILMGTFVVSFNWILTALILLSVAVFLLHLMKKKETFSDLLTKKELWSVIAALSAYVIVMCCYPTANLYRYYVVSSVLLIVLGLLALCFIIKAIWNNRKIKCLLITIICGLLMIQSYTTIDPVTIAIYPTITTGNSVVVPLPQYCEKYLDPVFTDAACANRQIMYLDKTIDRAYASIYRDCGNVPIKVLCSNEYVATPGHLGSLYCIWGYGYSSPSIEYQTYAEWNTVGQYRYLSYEYDSEKRIDPSYVNADTDLSELMDQYEHIYYMKMPWVDTVLEPLMERYSEISYVQTVEYRGWVLEVYRIK